MAQEHLTDQQGTVIAPDQVAVVVGPDGALNIIVPKDETAAVPEAAQALIAAAMRLTNDPAFYAEMLASFGAAPH